MLSDKCGAGGNRVRGEGGREARLNGEAGATRRLSGVFGFTTGVSQLASNPPGDAHTTSTHIWASPPSPSMDLREYVRKP